MNALVEELFHQVVNLPLAERARSLASRDVDEDPRREVEALLPCDLEASAMIVRDVGLAAMVALPQLETRGVRCGPYRLLHAFRLLDGNAASRSAARPKRANRETCWTYDVCVCGEKSRSSPNS